MGRAIKFKDNNGDVYPCPYYPIGSIYISVNNINPTNFFGGTWERIANGRTLVGVNENDTDFATPKKTGGSKFMQKHGHALVDEKGNNWGGSFYTPGTNYADRPAIAKGSTWYSNGYTLIAQEGEGDSGNLQPYMTVYIWCRIA